MELKDVLTKQNVSILGAGIVIGYILNPSLRWLYRKVYERYSAKPGTIVLKDGVYHKWSVMADGKTRVLLPVEVTEKVANPVINAA